MQKTERRKEDHVNIVQQEGAQYAVPNGFDKVSFVHCALPSSDMLKIDASCVFLGRKLSLPFMVTAITGGYPKAEQINCDLAIACERKNVAFGLGSQRAMIENPALAVTYRVKKVAPKVFLCGNIGAVQLAQYVEKNAFAKVESALSKVDADALCIHLNALQECIQPEGDRDWAGVEKAIGTACEKLRIPVIVKETGAGISGSVARKLETLGAKAIDVSGAGGTSWSAVELSREKDGRRLDEFRNWGLPTAESLRQCAATVKVPLIASGGIRNGLEAAKAIRLGAALAGAAYPFLVAQSTAGKSGVLSELGRWERGLKTAMFLTASRNLSELKAAPVFQR